MKDTWRIYYDRRDDDGKVWWSIDNGTTATEIKVSWFVLNVAGVLSRAPETHVKGDPSGWIEVYGEIHFRDGGVTEMATPWAVTHKRQLIERRKDLKIAGRTPARVQRVYCVRTEVIAIPDWAYEQAIPEIEGGGEYIWLAGRQLADLLVKLDREEGGNPDVLSVEARRCKVCGLLKLNLLAEQRRKLDESAMDGRTLPCGPECLTRNKQQRGKL